MLEVGCGNGSNVFPLLARNPTATLWACDLVPAALKTVVGCPAWAAAGDRVRAFLWDVVTGAPPTAYGAHARGGTPPSLPTADGGEPWTAPPPLDATVDIAVAMFVLSALPPAAHAAAFASLYATLRPGGVLAFRDYGLYDAAQLRAGPDNLVTPTLHRRGDGTLAYYFSVPEVTALATAAGFTVHDAAYATVRTVNRARGIELRRVFVHAKLVKPGDPSAAGVVEV